MSQYYTPAHIFHSNSLRPSLVLCRFAPDSGSSVPRLKIFEYGLRATMLRA